MNNKLYESDYYHWLQTTAIQLKRQDLEALDWENLIEEIESLGRKERAELRNRLTILFEHLLKLKYWDAEKEPNERGWKLTVKEQQIQIRRNLADSPSWKSAIALLSEQAYEDALEITKFKTGLETLPEQNPFSNYF
jgi:hypothetical protein